MYKKIKPKFVIFRIDQTELWNTDIIKIAKKIISIYLIDINEIHFICSPQKMYYANHLYDYIDNNLDIDLEDLCMEYNSIEEQNCYLDEKFINNIKNKDKYISKIKILKEDYKSEDNYDELTDKLIEYYNSNHIF